MNKEKIRYAGGSLFNINFNLYGFEELNIETTKENILNNFKRDYEKVLIETLKEIGLKYCGLEYYSPKCYNYGGDDIDLTIEVINRNKFKEYILRFRKDINLLLSKNKSCDGYIALTKESIKEEIKHLESNGDYNPDILVLSAILNKMIDFKIFNVYDYLVFDTEQI